MTDVLLWIGGIWLALQIINPLLIYFTQKMRANPNLVLIEPSNVSARITEFFSKVAPQLKQEGFVPLVAFEMTNPARNVETFLLFLINHQEGDKALITAIIGKDSAGFEISTLYLEFSTRFSDGEVFDTLNSEVTLIFKRVPHNIKTQVPSIQDPHLLYQLHRFVMRQKRDGCVKQESFSKLLPDDDDAVWYISKVLVEGYDEQVNFGRMKFDRQNTVYRPTLYGAFCMTLPLLWPWSVFAKARMKNREAAVLHAFYGQNGVGNNANFVSNPDL